MQYSGLYTNPSALCADEDQRVIIINFIHRRNIDSNSKKTKSYTGKTKNTQKISTAEHDPAECNRKPTLVVY